MQQELQKYLNEKKSMIEIELANYINKLQIPERLKESMNYSLQAGGKRIRPILVFASYDAYAKDEAKVMTSAVALEMIHTYSLIHDDLPAMDDDDYRRGKLTNHKQFDEATAILAGDALLTYSFHIITSDPLLSDHEKVTIINYLTDASGPKGMVGGQILDMEAENKSITLEKMEKIHELKTGELLNFAVFSGAYLAEATEKQLEHLKEYAYYLGLIFQVQDDILDVTGSEEKLGKPVGSDEGNNKSTYPKLLGLEGAMKQKELYMEKAKKALVQANAEHSMLGALVDYISMRDH